MPPPAQEQDVPNGGWGWMVVFGVAFTYVFNQSLASIFGLLFGDLLAMMGQETIGAALVMNMNCVMLNFTGIVAGPLLRIYSARSVSIAGSLLIALGLFASSFTTNLLELTVTYGFVVGIGVGLMSPATFIAVHSYFSTRRGQAVGLAMAGTGIGQMVMPHCVDKLMQWYGNRGCIMIVSALALNGIAGALLFQPVEWHTPRRLRRVRSESIVVQDFNLNTVAIVPGEPLSFCQRLCRSMDLAMFKDPVFLSISIGLALVYTASINFSMIFPYYLQDTAHLSRADAALCMSVLAGADVLSRLTLPYLTDTFHFSCRNIFLVGAVLLCGVRELMAMTTGRTKLIVMSVVFGYVRAATVVNQNLVVSEYAKKDQLPGALGLTMVTKALVVISIGQVLGWVRDYTQSYQMSMHAQNGCLVVTIVCWSAEMIYRRCQPIPKPQQ